jgi:RimJ/RimL family protein N-acetyltransferase
MSNDFWLGQRVRLRALEPTDADTFIAWNRDSQRARRLDFLWPPQSEPAVRAWVEAQSRKRLENDSFHWMIENMAREPVGSIATHHCDAHAGSFSYGIDIVDGQRRKGYAGEAIRMVLRYYFDELRYQKAAVPIHGYNEESIRLHERLGFVCEGRLRRMVYTGGAHHDLLWYGMTAEEFAVRWGEEGRG